MTQPFEELEIRFGEWMGNPNMVAVSSGTSALHIALEVMRHFNGRVSARRVLVPEFTMVACARAVVMAGMKPVFIDCQDNLLIDGDFEADFIDAVMPVHVYGRRCPMEAIVATAKSHGLYVVEDLAEGHGIKPHPDTDAAAWSFYRNKIVHGEEGGMIAFKDPDHADYAKLLRCQGFTSEHNFMHIPRGVNARMSNAHATPILESLKMVEINLQRRREIVECYGANLPFARPTDHRDSAEVDWVYDVRIPGMTYESQSSVVHHCWKLNVAARQAFRPMSSQLEFFDRGHVSLNAYRLSQEVMYLPVADDMTEEDTKRNCIIFREACEVAGLSV